MGECLKVALGIECGHASGASAGDGLTIDMILHIAGGKHTRNIGRSGIAFQPAARFDVAIIHLELSSKEIGVGLMPNRDKDTLKCKLLRGPGARMTNAHARHTALIACTSSNT